MILDESTFAELSRQHRRELHVHCYRMLASFDEAEETVQETLLRAWRSRASFDGSTLARAWLYRIATNVCLDVLRRRSRQLTSVSSFAEVQWLQPYPDRLLDEVASREDQPDAVLVRRETIALAFVAAVQVLPPRQRAAFLVRDVLGWSAAETAALLGTSVPAANSAVQRARTAMQQHLPATRSDWAGRTLTDEEQTLLDRFLDAHQRCDIEAAAAIAATDIRVTMPPMPLVFDGLGRFRTLLQRGFGPEREGDWRLLPTAANRMPAAASYLRRPGDSTFRPYKLDVLRVEAGAIREITTFGHHLFPELGLPATL